MNFVTADDRAFGFLVNPASGSGAVEAAVPLVRRLREAGRDVTVTSTSDAERTPDLVAEIVSTGRVVVSVGGDGTLASVAGAVSSCGGELAVVPAGRGNDFARMLNIPASTDQQAEMLLAGVTRPIDLLAAAWHTNGARIERIVAGSVYTGVDARAAELARQSRTVQRVPTALQYPAAAVVALACYRPLTARLEVDGQPTEHRAATVVIANSAYYGKGMKIAPHADVTDGQLDVIVIEAASRLDLIRSLPKVYQGRHGDLDEVTMLRGRSVRLSCASEDGKTVPVGADGEDLVRLAPANPGAHDPSLEVTIRPGALNVVMNETTAS